MSRPQVVLYVSASLDSRITMGTNTTMFDTYKQPELYAMLLEKDDWESFTQAVKKLYTPDMFLEGSNMLVAETEALTELPPYQGDPASLYEDFLPRTF